MDVLALLSLAIFFAAFHRDEELLVIAPLSLVILSFLTGNAILPFILSLLTFIIFFRWESSEIPEKKVHLDTLEKLAKMREKQLEEVRELDRRIRREQEKSVRDYLISRRAQHIEGLDRTNREMGIYCNEIRKQWE